MLGGNGLLFTSYTENVTSVETPDAQTVVVKTKKPDARIVGGLFIFILPEHVWGKVPIKQIMANYRPEIPLVGSGPYVVTEFDSNRIVRMERNEQFRGPKPKFDEIQFIKYGSADAVERALTLGEADLVTEVQEATFDRLGKTENVKTVKSPSPSFTELSFNMCPRKICPDAKFNPAVQDLVVRQAIGYAVDRERINEIATRNTSFPGHGLLPSYYKAFYSEPADDYPYDPDRAREMLDAAGYVPGDGDGGVRAKGDQTLSFDLFVRSESQVNQQAARLVKEMAAEVGVDFKVQVVSADKLTEITTRQVDGKMAPDFDTFIWGWGGDPYDPGTLLNLLTTSAIGGSSDSFYSNPEYDRLYAAADRHLRHRRAQADRRPDDRDQPARPAVPRAHRRPDPAGVPHRSAVGRRAVVPEARRRHHLRPGRLRADAHARPADRGERRRHGRRRRLERPAVRADRGRRGRARARRCWLVIRRRRRGREAIEV